MWQPIFYCIKKLNVNFDCANRHLDVYMHVIYRRRIHTVSNFSSLLYKDQKQNITFAAGELNPISEILMFVLCIKTKYHFVVKMTIYAKLHSSKYQILNFSDLKFSAVNLFCKLDQSQSDASYSDTHQLQNVQNRNGCH